MIPDTDILSAFAKIDRLDLMGKLFSSIAITPRIYEEILVPLKYGYDFPLKVIKTFDVLVPEKKEVIEYQKLLLQRIDLGRGELEAMVICKNRGCLFSSMDSRALRFAEEYKVRTLTMHSILRALWESNILSRKEVRSIISRIEEKKNTSIQNIENIFE